VTEPGTRGTGTHQLRPDLRVAVIGGGASGVMVAARLLDRCCGRVQVTIVDVRGDLGAGVAYGTTDPDHLLNVAAAAMSADPARSDDFVRWVEAEGLGDATTFVARRDYRRYLLAHLRRTAALQGCEFPELRQGTATAVHRSGSDLVVTLEGGGVLVADAVVVATGNPPPAVPAELGPLEGRAAWVPDPWAPGALSPPGPLRSVVLVGTGLTMVDVAITLAGRLTDGARGADDLAPMVAYSRSGLLPERHVSGLLRSSATSAPVDLATAAAHVAQLATSRVRDGSQQSPDDWRPVIDGLRPHVNDLWRDAPVAEQARFRSSSLRTWEVLRHRMSPSTAARYDELVRSTTLRTGAGRVRSIEAGDAGRVLVQLELDDSVLEIDADLVVNCTGPGRSWEPPANPLVVDLIQSGLARPDPHGLGIDCDRHGRLRDADGCTQSDLFAIGPPRRGSDLETTAVPELRVQADQIARALSAG